jgi:hypothetical protein
MSDPIGGQAGYAPGAYRVYSAWVRAGDTSSRAVHAAIFEAWRTGCREEAEARDEGRAPAALEVRDMVDGLAKWGELADADADAAHFAGVAAEVYCGGQPLRRRLLLAWRIVRPRLHWRGWPNRRRADR